eukprot:7676416-Lingulodinium_polyedra.AAC.1
MAWRHAGHTRLLGRQRPSHLTFAAEHMLAIEDCYDGPSRATEAHTLQRWPVGRIWSCAKGTTIA